MDGNGIVLFLIFFSAIVIYNRLPKKNSQPKLFTRRRYRKQKTGLEKIANRTTVSQKLALQKVMSGETTNVDALLPLELEELAAKVYDCLGYQNVKHTGGSNDGGVDVWMLNKKGHVEIVQCKQRMKRISRPELISFAKTMRQHHAEYGHYWAPNGFTQPAIDYADEKNIKLYESVDIRRLVLKVSTKI